MLTKVKRERDVGIQKCTGPPSCQSTFVSLIRFFKGVCHPVLLRRLFHTQAHIVRGKGRGYEYAPAWVRTWRRSLHCARGKGVGAVRRQYRIRPIWEETYKA